MNLPHFEQDNFLPFTPVTGVQDAVHTSDADVEVTSVEREAHQKDTHEYGHPDRSDTASLASDVDGQRDSPTGLDSDGFRAELNGNGDPIPYG